MYRKGRITMYRDLHAVISVRLFTDQKSFGPGVAELLHRVEEHHSLRAAAKSMELAYSKAWTIMKRAEESLGIKLIESSTGGRNGGGASLTGDGKRFLEAYDSYCMKIRVYSDELLEKEFSFYGEKK